MRTLLLLIGTNPLPNWVTLRALRGVPYLQLYAPERAVLLHTAETREQARVLQEHAQQCWSTGLTVECFPLGSAYDAQTIDTDVRRCLEQLGKGVDLHLNYTGGTKQMAVIATRAFERFLGEHRDIQGRVSYLDPREFRLRIVDRRNQPLLDSEDLRKSVQEDFATLVALHGFNILHRADGKVKGADPQILDVFARELRDRLIQDHPFSDTWKKYAREVKDKLCDARPSETDRLPFFDDPLGARLFEAFKLPKGATVAGLYDAQEANNRDDREDARKRFANFVDGGWLEILAFHAVKECAPRVWEVAQGLQAKPIKAEKKEQLDFETDILVLVGYQLIVLSCTTAQERSHVKSKGFEVLRRAQQLGGDEARALLLTLQPPEFCEKLEQDLAGGSSSNAGRAHVKVWGKQEVCDLNGFWDRYCREGGLV